VNLAALALGAALTLRGAAADPLPGYYGYSPDQGQDADAALSADEQVRLAASLASRDRLDATVWQPELAAQVHETVFDDLWDRLRTSKDPLATAQGASLERITLAMPRPGRPLKDGILLAKPGPAQPPLDLAGWRARLAAWQAAGWRIDRTEWHHDEYHPEATPPWSYVKVDIQATGPDGSRDEFRGRLRVTWHEPTQPHTPPSIADVDATGIDWLHRPKAGGFTQILDRTFARGGGKESTMLLAWDLAGHGRSDLILPGVNARFKNLGGNRFEQAAFLDHPVYPDPCGVIADFDGDGVADYLCAAGTPQRLLLYRGAKGGAFPDEPVPATDDPLELKAGSVITVADVNGDGLPDVWIGQYKNPYIGGTFPTPYYNANDSYPCYLLLNDGHGRFHDATAAAGFDAKRNRRNYCAVFLDLFGAGRPDLMTINDFAGVDIWRNLGGGRFEDATAQTVDDPMNFGMGVAVDDFARDGHPGFYVSGMGSTTMRRLAKMGLQPQTGQDVTLSRTRMGYGNRLYLWEAPGRYREPVWNDQVSRSGWSWGVVGFDPDLDGDRDLFILNGFISGRTSQDYCTTFWRHDVYTPQDESPKVVRHLLAVSTVDLNRGEISWNGYEKKRMFLHVSASEYVEAAHMFGLALEEDCRNLVADDFDLDGRPDLALLYEDRAHSESGGPVRFGLKVFRNELVTKNHWIGIRLKAAGKALPFGAVITVRSAAAPRVAVVLTGDSWRSQQAPVKLFGLGADPKVDAIEVRWPDGRISTLSRPAPDRYHDLAPPAAQ